MYSLPPPSLSFLSPSFFDYFVFTARTQQPRISPPSEFNSARTAITTSSRQNVNRHTLYPSCMIQPPCPPPHHSPPFSLSLSFREFSERVRIIPQVRRKILIIASCGGENQFNPRSPAILAVAKANNLNLDIVTITSSQDAPDYYRKLNRLAKVPTFVSSDGFVLSECIAIALYSTYFAFFGGFSQIPHSRSSGRKLNYTPCIMAKKKYISSHPNQPSTYPPRH